MAHLFVCYDREDRDFAEVVQAKLERAGHDTSMDFDILSAGDDWQDKLDLAIRQSDAIVVVMSPEARVSEHVAYEWAFALGAGVRVIPIELRTTPFPPRLNGLHRLDFTGQSRPWDTLLAEVARAQASRRGSSNVALDPDTPAAVQHAVSAIDSLAADERLAAINTLAQTDHPAAVAALTRALDHAVKDVRAAAARVFPDPQNPKIVPGLIDAYRNDLETWVRRGAHGDPPDAERVYKSADRMGAAAVPALMNGLQQLDGEPYSMLLRRTLLRALGRTKSAAALLPLQEAMQHEDADTRGAAAEALGELEEPAGAAALRSALADSEEAVRSEAAESLGRLRDPAAVSGLIECLVNDTTGVRTRAAKALGAIGDRSAVAALVAALHDDNYAMKRAAAEALGRLGDPAAIPHLRDLLGPNEKGHLTEVDQTVMAALVRLADAASFEDIGNRLVDFRSGYYGGSVYAELARYGQEGIDVLLRVLCNAKSNSTQSEAASALASVRTPEAVNALKTWRRTHS